MHTRHTEIIWLKVSNENLPCEHLCGGNKSISSQLIILRFGTVSNTTEYYTTVFESDDQVGIWKLEFLTQKVHFGVKSKHFVLHSTTVHKKNSTIGIRVDFPEPPVVSSFCESGCF